MRGLVLLGLLGGASGCLMSGNYHSAKTLNKGESQVGLTFSATRYTYEDVVDEDGDPNTPETTRTESIVLPAILPELAYHLGVAENVEVGGRVGLGSGGLELDVKYRFYHNDKVHLAVAPALGYQGLFFLEGYSARLPAILTYELADNVDFTIAGFASTSHYDSVLDSDEEKGDGFTGSLVSTGAAVGFDLHGDTFSIRPAVEFTRYIARLDDNDGSSSEDGFNTVNFLVHIAWTGGKEKQQLDRIERKIDAMQPQPPPPAYPTAPPGAPPPPPPPPPAPY